MLAAEKGKTEAVFELLNMNFDVNLQSSSGSSAIDLAWTNNHQDVVLLLLRSNSMFPKQFKARICIGELKEFVTSIEMFFIALKSENVKLVERFLNENSQLKYVFNFNNQSALAEVVLSKKFKMVDILLGLNRSLAPFEKRQKFTHEYSCEEHKKIRKAFGEEIKSVDKQVAPKPGVRIKRRGKLRK